MSHRRLIALAAAAGIILPVAAWAQATGGGVPAYEPPAPVGPPERTGELIKRAAKAAEGGLPGAPGFGEQSGTVSTFASSYAAHGKPRLALYWNRQLSEALSEWYSDTRVVSSANSNSSMSGEFNLNQSGSSQESLEIQRRVQDRRRPTTSESFEWEFQDAFLAPFLEAGATIIDRAAMVRFTGADMQGSTENTVEVRALQGKADYLMEILVASNWRSSTGYELRTRIIDIKTGAIVAMVNAKNLKEWNPEKDILASSRGFTDPEDNDDDDENFGPQGEKKYQASASGFHAKRKPPKLPKIAQNLAYNTMTGLMRQWK